VLVGRIQLEERPASTGVPVIALAAANFSEQATSSARPRPARARKYCSQPGSMASNFRPN
jgi:hypothetical protein